MSWGIELWDRYEELCTHTNSGLDFIEKSVASFIKERGSIEKEYAKKLRDLVKKYTPKSVTKSPEKTDNSKKSGPASIVLHNSVSADEEFTHILAFKEVRPYETRFFSIRHLCFEINRVPSTSNLGLEVC